MALNLLRKNNSVNIEAYHDAVMTYAMLGDCILNNVYSSCQTSISSNLLTIQPGIIIFGGRIVEISKNSEEQLDISSFSSSTVIYVKLRIVIASDDSNSTCDILASDSSAENKGVIDSAGTYDINLFKVENKTTITRLITLINPGEAKNAKNLLSTGTIAGVDFFDVFLNDMSGVRYAKQSDKCSEAEGFLGGSINKVSSNLYMPGRGVYLLTKSDSVIGTFNLSLSANSTRVGSLSTQAASNLRKGASVVFATINDELVPGLARVLEDGGAESSYVENYPHCKYKDILVGYNKNSNQIYFRNPENVSRNYGNCIMKFYAFNF